MTQHTTIKAWSFDEGMAIARWLLREQVRMNATIVGGLRRQEKMITRIELLTPHTDAYDRLQKFVMLHVPDDVLIKPPQHGRFLRATRGYAPFFKEAHFELARFDATPLGCPGTSPDLIPLRIFRYDHGPEGNEGWATLIRTGPNDYGRACLWHWARVSRGGRSEGGYPMTADNRRLPCPSEAEAYRLLDLPFTDPKDRHPSQIPGWTEMTTKMTATPETA